MNVSAEPGPVVAPSPTAGARTSAGPEPSTATPPGVPVPSDAANAVAQQDSIKSRAPALVILYSANSDRGREAAEQLAARAGVPPDQIEARATADVPSSGIIRYYAREHHAWARRLGQELADMGYTWRIQNLSGRVPSSEHPSVEISLPDRRGSP